MSKVPRLTPRKLMQILKKRGFHLDHTTGSHYIFYHPITGKRVTVPYHTKDIPIGTLHSILRQAEISLT
ncbi:type II toxin-antitoxin system HicA family toxin [Candidatus Uhrbacteria bacterium]|nr:type II toxin-antitoxin system HicA family toxin [Candidatus Uhrbacteria bacterium]